MKVVALISGGKDSCYNMMCCQKDGHEVVCLGNLFPADHREIDSYMYQSVGSEGIKTISDALDLPLFRQEITGKPRNTEMEYVSEDQDEVEDLFVLLQKIKENYPDIKGVSVGAINSTYQKVRVENVCARLNLVPLCYLWERNQLELFDEMIAAGVEAIIIKVAAMGLQSKHLGMSLAEIRSHLLDMHDKYGSHICGEGGEFETFVLDCPMYKKKIFVEKSEVVAHGVDNGIASVAYLKLCQLSLIPKSEN